MDVTAVFNQSAFRGRNDDGDETTATWKANENTNWTQNVDENFRVRIEFEETATASPAVNTSCQLQYNLNSAGWVAVSNVSSVVRVVASPNVADGANTTDQLATSAKTFDAGASAGYDENTGIAGSASTSMSNEQYELEFCCQIISTDVVDDDSIQLRLVRGGAVAFATYTNTPTITVQEVTVSAAITGTITPSATEADIVTGGKTIIITLTGDTWVASGATFDGERANIAAGIDSAQSEATGWDAVVKAGIDVGDVVRTSDTVVTVTLDAEATYNITATETITVTVPASAVTGGVAIVGSPTFTVTAVGAEVLQDVIGVGVVPTPR